MRKPYLSSAQRSPRLLRAARRQDDAQRKASVRVPRPMLDSGRVRALLGDARPDSAYMSTFKQSLDICVGSPPSDKPSALHSPAALDVFIGASPRFGAHMSIRQDSFDIGGASSQTGGTLRGGVTSDQSTLLSPAALDVYIGANPRFGGREVSTRWPVEEDQGRRAAPGRVAALPHIRAPRVGDVREAALLNEELDSPNAVSSAAGRWHVVRQPGDTQTPRSPPTPRELGSVSKLLLRALQADPYDGEA
jgi:hypothetical protein